MVEIVGYKKSYTFIVIAGITENKYSRKFDTEEKGDKWVEQMETWLKDAGGCKLWEVFEHDEPIYANRDSHLDEALAKAAQEAWERRERRRERGE